MNVIALLHIYAVIITLKNGFFSVVKVLGTKKKIGMETSSPRATTEIRAVWGGIYLGLGIAGLVFPIPEVYKTLAIAYAVSNGIRGISMVIDKSIDRLCLQSMSYEVVLAFLLVI
jgi:hypothetical protein